jgi:arylsulfatase A-like enzyme
MISKLVLGLVALGLAAVAVADERPNIVFILTNDQDAHMSGLKHMPLAQKYLSDQGTTFERHYCTGTAKPPGSLAFAARC